MKKSFALITTLFLLVVFSYLSINIIQNKNYSNQIDKIKYLTIQASIHMRYIKQNISSNINLNDDRFILNIIVQKNETNTTYHIYLKTKNELDAHISIYEKVIK